MTGGKPELLRVLDHILILNGSNNQKMASIDLNTSGFPIVNYTAVTNPTTTMTTALTGITTGALKIYYAYSYSGNFGETALSPIVTQSINIPRDQWQTAATPGKITLTFGDTPPAGATFRNMYIALAATGGTITATDMLQVSAGIDLNATTFIDDGSLDINLGNPAPTENSTDSFKVSHGIVEDGNPILFGDPDNPENIYIGGGGPYALSFSTANNGFKAQPELGTNFVPTVIIGFRNGQGQPSLTVLYSNTEGISKQSVLEQQTVNYGNTSFNVWGVTSQHYGAAGVAATNSAINYNGKLLFMSTDGFMSMNTQPLRQNVISTDPLSIKKIDKLVRAIKNSAMGTIVGTGWGNKFMWTIPNDGFDTPQQLLIADDNHNDSWYVLDIPANWIGVVSPSDSSAFVYISQGNKTYQLQPGDTTYDIKNGVPVPFSTKAVGAMAPLNSAPAHNNWGATVQAVFYVEEIIGNITVGINYKDQNGTLKNREVLYEGPAYTPSGAGGWGDMGWAFGGVASPAISGFPRIDASAAAITNIDDRIKVPIDDIMNEYQWYIKTDAGYNHYRLRSVSPEGINLGVRPDLQ
jgi:hypothetical protein